jgi:hypothetical protein
MPDKTIKAYLWEMLDNLPSGKYGLWYLTDTLNLITGRRTMCHTVRDYCKDYASRAGGSFKCVVHNDSIYEYIAGVKITGSLGGKE